MLRIKADRFVEATHYLAFVRAIADQFKTDEKTKIHLKEPDHPADHRLRAELEKLLAECEALNLRLTITHIKRMLGMESLSMVETKEFVSEVYQRFRDELTGQMILFVASDRADFYEQPLRGWAEVVDRFGCSFDIEEARKCLATERYTAAVFHLMRVVEAAVIELQVFLGDTDVKAHFGSVVVKLERMLQGERYENVPLHLRGHLQFLREVLTQLHAVKDSWRDKVAHVNSFIVPADTFTEELARGIHDATLLLMKKLAAGLPKASGVSASAGV